MVLSNPSYHLVVYGLLLIVFLTYLPQGLVGIRLRWWRRLIQRQPAAAAQPAESHV